MAAQQRLGGQWRLRDRSQLCRLGADVFGSLTTLDIDRIGVATVIEATDTGRRVDLQSGRSLLRYDAVEIAPGNEMILSWQSDAFVRRLVRWMTKGGMTSRKTGR